MYFKSLSLTALGLAVLITGQFTVNAEPASDIAIPHGDLADSYLEIFAADETEDDDFDLSEEFADESTHLVKRGQSCSKYHTGINLKKKPRPEIMNN
jgi:hypothetical protein